MVCEGYNKGPHCTAEKVAVGDYVIKTETAILMYEKKLFESEYVVVEKSQRNVIRAYFDPIPYQP